MANKCDKMGTLITAYVDQELEEKAVVGLERHLQECSTCRERLEAERRVKALLRERVRPVTAPPELRARIRRRLQRETLRKPSLLDGIRSYFTFHPVASAAVAFALLVLILIPSYFAFVDNPFAEKVVRIEAEGATVELAGKIVCVDCAVMLRAHSADPSTVVRVKSEHEQGLHHPGLMTDDGEIFNFLHTGKGLDLLKVPSHGGEKVKIYGVLFRKARLIEVRSYQFI